MNQIRALSNHFYKEYKVVSHLVSRYLDYIARIHH
jgi:hypothetical protein